LEPESIVYSGNISFYPINTGIIVGLIVLILLLLFSALISGAEVAFFSLSPSSKLFINQSKRQVHHLIRDLLKIPDKLLATILIANTFVNVGIVILSTYLFNNIVNFSEFKLLGFIIEIVLITFILLLFGEILPKIYAGSFSMSFAEFMSRPLLICSKLFTPLTFILIHSTSFVDKRLVKHNVNISIEDISQALELTSKEELSDDKGILEGIVKFGSTSVYQIMTPRIDVVAIENDYTADKIIKLINESGYSRIPVFDDTFDKIDGILYIKDLLPHLNQLDTFQWQSLLRPPYYVPENKKIDDLLKEFQKEKVHMAIVVDEYGGTAGIVTLEDILEEIVGDITDEFDDDDLLFSKLNDNTYLFDGKTQLIDFYRICDLDDDYFHEIKGEADTLAGLLLEMKGNFPKLNEKLIYQNIDFIVESLDNRRIKKIKVVFNKTSH
jgi:putative hemolysin